MAKIHGHNLTIRKHDPLSLISVHRDPVGDKLNVNTVCLVDQANRRHLRELLEAWHSLTDSMNRHMELDQNIQ